VRTIFRITVVLLLVAAFSASAMAQKHELALTLGGNFPKNDQANPGNSFAVGAQYDGRIFHVPTLALYLDVPIVVATNTSFNSPSPLLCPIPTCPAFVRDNYRSFFFTPGVKLRFGAPAVPFQPYVVGGVGLAHYSTAGNTFFGPNSSNKAVFEVGGGVDIKLVPHVGLRGEVRDFISGTPNLAAVTNTGHQHNIAPQVGLVFKF